MPATIIQVGDSLPTMPLAIGWQSSVRCIPRGLQVCHHLTEAEIRTNPPKPQSQSIGASKKKKKNPLIIHAFIIHAFIIHAFIIHAFIIHALIIDSFIINHSFFHNDQ